MNRLLLFGLAVVLVGCGAPSPPTDPSPDSSHSAGSSTVVEDTQLQRLDESWQIYKQQFIQADGRVIDREAGDRTVSEGQAYALLRAVMADDPTTFSVVLSWSE
ncbi:MAG: glycosyl hydrolase family 8, partial [Elainellaceae cyanobacterium]